VDFDRSFSEILVAFGESHDDGSVLYGHGMSSRNFGADPVRRRRIERGLVGAIRTWIDEVGRVCGFFDATDEKFGTARVAPGLARAQDAAVAELRKWVHIEEVYFEAAAASRAA
jgi:hypothetical protein